MNQERRIASMDNLLITLGEIKNVADRNHEWLKDIDNKLAIQNGRIGSLEKWKAYMYGVTTVIIVLIIPVFIRVMSQWLINGNP